MDTSNVSVVLAVLRHILASKNVTIREEDLSHGQILSLLHLAGAISGQTPHISETDLAQYWEYKIHKSMTLYIPPVLLFLGILGNCLSFVILRRKTMADISTNTLLSALSIADLVVLFVGLFRKWIGDLTRMDIQTESRWLCKIIAVLGYSTSQYSVWLIVAVTIERYIVVCHPLSAPRFCKKERARKIVLLLALVFLVINIHLLWTVDLIEGITDNTIVYKCEGALSHKRLVNSVWPWIDAVFYSFSPTVIIMTFNIIIIRQVIMATRGRSMLQNGAGIKSWSRRMSNGEKSTKITVMLLTISFAFLVTSLPMSIIMITSYIWSDHFENDASFLARSLLMRTTAELLMYLNHSINFFLYVATGQKFRNVFVRMICKRSESNSTTSSDHSQNRYSSIRKNGRSGSDKFKKETAI